MRRFALILCFCLLSPWTLAQDDDDIDLGDEGCGCGPAEEEEQEHDISPPENLPAQEVLDKVGNFKLKLPAGWEISHEPPEEKDDVVRLAAQRMDVYGNAVIGIVILRRVDPRAETFSLDSPGDVLDRYVKRGDFDNVYGERAGSSLRPDINEGILLGGAEKSGEYEISSITMEEDKELREKEALKRRDPKVVVPEYKPIITRGRIALISPYIYFIRAGFARQLNHREELVAEYRQVMESFEFLEMGEMPGPLVVMGQKIGDTQADPANTEQKKIKTVYSERGRKTYNVELTYTRPKGFVAKHNPGGNISLQLYAQDGRNNWVEILVVNSSAKRVGDENKVFQDKKEVFESWASNWESKARGVKVPRKPQKFGLGKIRGAGYKRLEGTVEKFRGTWEGVLMDKSGWRTMLTIETRGEGDKVFDKEIKTFIKSLKFNFKAK